MKYLIFITAFVSLACSGYDSTKNSPDIVSNAELKWEKLNPARGEKSPQAAVLWGDLKGNKIATGFLVRFIDGFESPPHIHNVTYKGVVISGLVHNDDPKAEKLWMPTGSFWKQPLGENHITAAKGKNNLAFIEIESAPYLVMPPEKAFLTKEKPINMFPSNIIWLDDQSSSWISGPHLRIAYLWGQLDKEHKNGTFLKLKKRYSGRFKHNSNNLKLVIITGKIKLKINGDEKKLSPSSYVGFNSPVNHEILCESSEDCIFYVKSLGKYEFAQARE